jgi:hypothetical protein
MPDKVNRWGYLINALGDHLPIPSDYNSSNCWPMMAVLALSIASYFAAPALAALSGAPVPRPEQSPEPV